MIDFVLRFFACFAWLLRWMGVDYEQFRTILQVKLTLDNRKAVTPLAKASGKEPSNVLRATLVTNALFGLFLGTIILRVEPALLSLTVIQTFIMTMSAMTLVADFSSLLLDATDNSILLPRPVDGRTILVTRLAHMGVHLSLIVLSLSLGAMVIGTIYLHILFAPLFLLTLMLMAGLMICLVAMLYLVAARFMSGERFKNVLLYLQMAMTVAIIGGYQFLPGLTRENMAVAREFEQAWWIYLIPPAWWAAPFDMLDGAVRRPQIILTLIGVAAPVLVLAVVVFVLAPRFIDALLKLGTTEQPAPGSAGARAPRWTPASVMARVLARDPVQRAAFEWTWTLCARDRKFKLRTYPIFAFVLVIGVSMLFNLTHRQTLPEALHAARESNLHLLLLYFSCPMILTSIFSLRYSDAWEAAWIYHALPVAAPGAILMGALKAVMCRFVLPIFLAIGAVVLAVWGLRVWTDVLIAAVVTLAMNAAYAAIYGRQFPFSARFSITDSSGRFIWNVVIMLLVLGLGGIHRLLVGQPLLLSSLFVVMAGLGWLAARMYARTTWETLAARAE